MNLQTEKYLSRPVCDSVKGLFIITVFYRHIMPYLYDLNVDIEWSVLAYLNGFLRQLIVVMFLFYSGYGVMYSVMHKGAGYVQAMPRHRLLNTLLNFMVAVAVFWVLQAVVLGKSFGVGKVLLSMIGWDSLGNSNWYIFVILLCYALTYLVFSLIRDTARAAWALAAAVALSIIPLMIFKQGWWYDTIMAYPLGVLWCLNREQIEEQMARRYWWIFAGALLAFLIFSFLPLGRGAGLLLNFRSIFFAILVLQLTMLLPVQSTVLGWLGKNLFPLYIYQRLSMVYLSEFDGGNFAAAHPYAYIAACAAITLLLALLYRLIEIKIK